MKRIIPYIIPALCLFFLMCLSSGYASEIKGGQRPIFISIVAPFSGPLAECGRSMLRGARLRSDEQEDESWPREKAVQLIALDDRGEPSRARQVAENIANHPAIVAVVGHLTTKCTLAAFPFYHAARLTTVSPVAGGVDIDTVQSPYLFRTILSEQQQAISLARYIHRTMTGTTVALLYEASSLGAQLKDSFLLAAGELGLPVKLFPIGNNPFHRLPDALHTISMVRPEVVFVAGGYRLAALIHKKWPEEIDKPVIVGTYRLISEEFVELVGTEGKGIMAAHPCIWNSDFQRGVKIRARYERTWKHRMDWLAAQAYDAVDLVLWAIRESGSNLGSLNEAIRSLQSQKHALPGLAGPIYFNADGSLAREVSIAEYANGRWRLKKEQAVGS